MILLIFIHCWEEGNEKRYMGKYRLESFWLVRSVTIETFWLVDSDVGNIWLANTIPISRNKFVLTNRSLIFVRCKHQAIILWIYLTLLAWRVCRAIFNSRRISSFYWIIVMPQTHGICSCVLQIYLFPVSFSLSWDTQTNIREFVSFLKFWNHRPLLCIKYVYGDSGSNILLKQREVSWTE